MKRLFVFVSLMLAVSAPLSAGEPAFSGIMDIYNNMSPQQRAQVDEAAKEVRKELEAMSITQRSMVFKAAKKVAGTIDAKNVDPSRIDTSKEMTLDEISQHLEQQLRSKN